jgi:enamine deaminase RidA (YjgF/YER057c/UK114 family)
MTPRPGRVLSVIEAPFSRQTALPSSRAVKASPEFVALREPVLRDIGEVEEQGEGAMIVEAKLQAMGLSIPDLEQLYRTNVSGARYISHYAVGNVLYLSGTTPLRDGQPFNTGVVGKDLSLEQGYEAARYAALTSLAAIKYALGDLDRLQQVVQLIGFVNSAPGFADQPRVINGATDLLVELYGERGKPTRAAIGCQGLALNHSVELIMTVLFSGDGVRPPLARDQYAR